VIRIGVDVGGTGIKGAAVDVTRCELVSERLRVKTPRGGAPDAVIARVVEMVGQLGGEGMVGVGLPAVISGGVVMTAAHLDPAWVGVHAIERIAEAIGRPCTVLNDADAAGLAEMRQGVGVGRRGVVLMLTLGTGIGSALFVDGHLVPNTEFGHIEIRGKAGEARAAASVRDRKGLTWEEWADRLNEYLDRIDRLVWPDLIILGGGVTKDADAFVPLLRCRPQLMVAEMRNAAGIVGAAMRAFDEESLHGTPVSTAAAPQSGSSL